LRDDALKVPQHLAVIMDGNGRWAQRQGLPRLEGHRAGVKSVRRIVEECRRLGVRYLTLYAFSSENWRRPEEEVTGLMGLLSYYLDAELKLMLKHQIRLRSLGNLSRLPEKIRSVLNKNEERTKECQGMDLILALSYGARDEIVEASKRIASQVQEGKLRPEDISESIFSANLLLPDVPDPDLMIRTSNESRLSNFLLWQLAYTEIVISPLYFPEFDEVALRACFEDFGRRQRRFGMIAEQLQK